MPLPSVPFSYTYVTQAKNVVNSFAMSSITCNSISDYVNIEQAVAKIHVIGWIKNLLVSPPLVQIDPGYSGGCTDIVCDGVGARGFGSSGFEVRNIGTQDLTIYGCTITGGGGNIFDFTTFKPDGSETSNENTLSSYIMKPGESSFSNFRIQTWDSDANATPDIIDYGGSFPVVNVFSDDLSGTTHTTIDDYIGDSKLESKWDISISWTIKS